MNLYKKIAKTTKLQENKAKVVELCENISKSTK